MSHTERSAEAVGQRLTLTRQALGLAQNEFAKRAGISPSRFNHYETGRHLPSLDAAQSLCDAHDLTLDWIFRGDASGLRYSLVEAMRLMNKARSDDAAS